LASGKLRITEVYASVQGESTHAGKACVFVRLTGCDLRCTWCDSEYTFTGGQTRTIDDVVAQAHGFGVHTIEVTGGEPLLQKDAPVLMQRLLDLGHEVLLETGGHRSIAPVPPQVHVIMDLKAPDSGMSDRNDWSNIERLQPHHEVKCVIASRADYEWSRDRIAEHRLDQRCTVLVSPVWGQVEIRDLVAWMLEDSLPARLSLQIHKVIWDATTTGV